MPISWDSLGTTVGINVGVAVGVFFIFNYLRRVPVVADYYSAKRKLSLPFRCATQLRSARCQLVHGLSEFALCRAESTVSSLSSSGRHCTAEYTAEQNSSERGINGAGRG